MLKVILERYPYRYVDVGVLDNGQPDYRIQKYEQWTGWKDKYELDNSMQLTFCIEDFDYTKWLCGDPAYVKDSVKNYWSEINN